MITQDDDDGNMYTSIQELRDEADELQLAMEECEKEGDVDKMNQLQLKLQSTQSQLLEKNEQRHQARYCFLHFKTEKIEKFNFRFSHIDACTFAKSQYKGE